MSFTVEIIPHTLRFKRPAGTSRGIYRTHRVWYVCVRSAENPIQVGWGECAPLPDLSPEADCHYEARLQHFAGLWQSRGEIPHAELVDYSSIRFGFEVAWKHFQTGSFRLWDSSFARGEKGIAINGLVWMNDFETMLHEAKAKAGFRCMKFKIGAIDFEKECRLVKHIRALRPHCEIRLDANGAFSPDEALKKLATLSAFGIHSVEQPIRAGQWQAMRDVVAHSPIPVALDEELIGIHQTDDKIRLLDTILPHFIILKPTLHGGISGANEWIRLAEERGIGWWATSALESNIGLNAIAQWCATLGNPLPQGLGTGSLYENNIRFPLEIKEEELWFFGNEHTQITIPTS